MVERLCQLNCHDIRALLGGMHRLVAQTNYVCGSCARSSDEKGALSSHSHYLSRLSRVKLWLPLYWYPVRLRMRF